MTVEQVIGDAFDRRVAPLESLGRDASAVARACCAMAKRFQSGGRLLVFGNGSSATDAQHVAVEFVHPAIVGKRSLPAWSLGVDIASVTGIANDEGPEQIFAHQLAVLGRTDDIALGLSPDGRCADVVAGFAAARKAGMLTVALVGGDGGDIAASGECDHVIVVPSDDVRVVKEGHVTAYHVLWELVHVFFDQTESPSPDTEAGGIEGLYPFLYGGAGDEEALIADVARSTAEKVAEIIDLRQEAATVLGAAIADCAAAVAAAARDGGTVFAFGNGGSSTDAQDVATTFLAGRGNRRPIPAVSLTADSATLTALSNDVSFEVVFARQLRAFGRAGDVAIGLSTSGGSANVLAGIDEAKKIGMVTVGLAGYGGGRMAERPSLDHLFAVPSSSVHRVQEVQTTVYHVLWEATQALLV
jgi:D-sedoheptulose 7-phosphate isomerase